MINYSQNIIYKNMKCKKKMINLIHIKINKKQKKKNNNENSDRSSYEQNNLLQLYSI